MLSHQFELGYLCKLRDWIPIEKLNCGGLSMNPNAIRLLEKNPGKIDWYYLSRNPNAIHLLEKIQRKFVGIGYRQIQMRFDYWNKIQIKFIGIV